MKFEVGQPVRIALTFTANRVKVDPSTAVVKLRDPNDEITTLTPSRDALGKYHVSVTPTLSGLWRWRVESTGYVTVREGQFTVPVSYFA